MNPVDNYVVFPRQSPPLAIEFSGFRGKSFDGFDIGNQLRRAAFGSLHILIDEFFPLDNRSQGFETVAENEDKRDQKGDRDPLFDEPNCHENPQHPNQLRNQLSGNFRVHPGVIFQSPRNPSGNPSGIVFFVKR